LRLEHAHEDRTSRVSQRRLPVLVSLWSAHASGFSAPWLRSALA
jgi:hypothetical protein